MKKMFGYGPVWLSILFGAIPYVAIQADSAGFTFELYYPLATYAVLVVLELVIFAGIKYYKVELGELTKIFTVVFLLVSVVSVGCYGTLLKKWDYSSVVFILLVATSVISAAVVMFHELPGKVVKIAFAITTLVVGAVVWLFLFMSLFFGNIADAKVMYSRESPEGKYIAEVIDDDQGALGGYTIVQVKRKESFSFFLGRIYKDPVFLCRKGWGKWDKIEFEWVDEDTLLIDGTEYTNEGEW
ncbi:MAG: hypothetical protein J6J79_00530 [Lachnospiraceae bacterium]|nr:hypothetical protein [Lachnospiraceae bacterium]